MLSCNRPAPLVVVQSFSLSNRFAKSIATNRSLATGHTLLSVPSSFLMVVHCALGIYRNRFHAGHLPRVEHGSLANQFWLVEFETKLRCVVQDENRAFRRGYPRLRGAKCPARMMLSFTRGLLKNR